MSSPWNHGKISRNAAEQLLVANGKNGAFLVRQSESVNDAHVLSLWFDGMVHHFRILRKENMFVVQAAQGSITRMFTTLEDVIELFKQPGQGLPHMLVEPISNIVNEMEHDSDDEPDQEKDMVDGRMEPAEECIDISIQLINRLAQMDYSGLGNDFCSKVQCYLNGGFDRDGKRMNGSEPATDLQDLIVNCADGVKRELKEFLKKIVFLQELFCTDDDFKKLVPGGLSARQSNDVSPYDDLVQDLAICVAGMKSVEVLAHKSYQQHAGPMKDEQSQTRTFEVTSCGNFKTRSYLKVDITEGKLLIMKNENESTTDSTTVEHDKILQLVKDPSTPKLTLKIAKGNREYLFKDIQDGLHWKRNIKQLLDSVFVICRIINVEAREYLCLLVQYMKNTHDPNKKEPKQISIFVGTWNMGSATPQNIESWLKCEGTGEKTDLDTVKLMGHDIYAIGTQESSVSETGWVSKIKMALKNKFIADYKTVAVYSLWGIRLVILAKREHTNRISRIEKSSVKTGIANTLGNKGGVGISFDFSSTSLCFINCHLTSGNEDLRKQRRQQNYMDILKGLNLGHKTAYDLTNQFHHVFWFGDLNYRIDMPYEEIIKAVQVMDYKVLTDNDQLQKEKDLGNVFVNFHENVLHFPPTYRYKRGTRDTYDHIKVKRAAGNRINVPSWCDRVLWRSFPGLTVEQKSYGCTDDIVTSDHSPVFASFDVPIKSQIGASPGKERPNLQANKPLCKIHIPFIKVKIKTVSKTEFYLEFHSVCLVTSVTSKPGKQSSPWDPPRTVNSKPTLTSYLEWSHPGSLPELNPIFDNPDYLREQHILIAVKSENGDESYGECVVSLKGHLFNSPQSFESDLTHGGIKAGEIKGSMNILNAKQAVVSRRPPVHAKPDVGIGAKPSSHRPFSCVAPNVTGTISTSATKSSSLGRALTRREYSAQPPRDTSQISTYVEIHDLSSANESDNPLYQAMTTESSKPPPLPAKMNPSKTSTLPRTVDEFLSKIGLRDYLSNLCDNGFDNIIFLDEISDEDLADSGITNTGHIRKILDEVENLRKAGAFNS